MAADIEANFYYYNSRKFSEGFRPAHMISEGELTTGVHHYYDSSSDKNLSGTIEFIAPEYYPHTLWIGKRIDMYDGSENIGYVEVTNIFNKILEKIVE